MTSSLGRQLHSSPKQREIPDLLQTIFAAELLAPSRCLWLVSPWISDIPVLDNQANGFFTVEPSWARQRVRLSQTLAWLSARGTTVHIATRGADHNRTFLDMLQARAHVPRLRVHVVEELHEKGLLGDGYYLSGSMNFTHNGISALEEIVTFVTAPDVIARNRLILAKRWGE